MVPSSFSKGPSVRRIVVVTRPKSKNYGRSSIRGNHMNLGIPSAAGFTDLLRSVFLEPPFRRGEPSPRWD